MINRLIIKLEEYLINILFTWLYYLFVYIVFIILFVSIDFIILFVSIYFNLIMNILNN